MYLYHIPLFSRNAACHSSLQLKTPLTFDDSMAWSAVALAASRFCAAVLSRLWSKATRSTCECNEYFLFAGSTDGLTSTSNPCMFREKLRRVTTLQGSKYVYKLLLLNNLAKYFVRSPWSMRSWQYRTNDIIADVSLSIHRVGTLSPHIPPTAWYSGLYSHIFYSWRKHRAGGVEGHREHNNNTNWNKMDVHTYP